MSKTLRRMQPCAISVCTLALSLLVASRVWAYTLSVPQRTAYTTLQRTDYFAVGGVGAAGTTSGSEAALRVLLAHPHCGLVLLDVLKTARPAGQLYALAGLKLKAPSLFQQNINVYLARRETVSVMEGCLGSNEAVSVVAGRIQHGAYDARLRRPQNPQRVTPGPARRQPAKR